MTKKKPNNPKRRDIAELSTLDDFLKEDGVFEKFQTRAIKEVLAWQLAVAMKKKKLSRQRLARAMGTSRSQISRLLNPNDGNVTLNTLQRAAAMVGCKVRLELV